MSDPIPVTSLAEPIAVRRVRTATGSHIEPALNLDWPLLTQLRWKAGVVLLDSGLHVQVTEWSDGTFSLSGPSQAGGWARGNGPYHAVWAELSAMGYGAEITRAYADRLIEAIRQEVYNPNTDRRMSLLVIKALVDEAATEGDQA